MVQANPPEALAVAAVDRPSKGMDATPTAMEVEVNSMNGEVENKETKGANGSEVTTGEAGAEVKYDDAVSALVANPPDPGAGAEPGSGPGQEPGPGSGPEPSVDVDEPMHLASDLDQVLTIHQEVGR